MSRLVALLALSMMATAAMPAGAAELRVLITTAMKAAIDELAPAFEHASGHTLRITYGPSGALAKRVADGEALDLVILAGGIDDLIRQGKVAPGARDIAKVRIGVGVRRGAPKPDIATVEAFKRTLIAA